LAPAPRVFQRDRMCARWLAAVPNFWFSVI
jgi:hypothetical protein